MSRFRNFCFTSYINVIPTKYKYFVCGEEICPTTGKTHYQGYIEFENPIAPKTARERIGNPSCHTEPRKGTAQEAATYCKKDGKFIELGDISSPGSRTDLHIVKDSIINDRIPINELLENNIITNLQQLKFAEALLKYQKPKERTAPEIWWIYGSTGTGKSRFVFDREGFEDLYRVEPECKWFDGYTNQEAVLFDDFRGGMMLSFILQITDRYPLRLACKGGFINWIPKRIYFTSCKHPEECYKNCRENITQLIRRITHIKWSDSPKWTECTKCTEVEGNTGKTI